MRNILICSLCLFFGLITQINSQVIYNHKIDSLINLVSVQRLIKTNKEITGDTVTNIGGISRRILTRYYGSPGNLLAAQYINERFSGYGLATRYQMLNTNIINVIGWKTGIKYPNQYFLIGAHYDNFVYGGTIDTIYGADDNGTGLCVLLELARLLQGFNTDFSIAFVAFNGEETSGIGSQFYADSAYLRGDSLIGVLNAEMLGYDGNNDNKVTVVANVNSEILYNNFISTISTYQLSLVPIRTNSAVSDHYAFWNRGFKAISTSEYINDLTPHYHTINDRWYNLTQSMFEKMTKANIATFLSWATANYCEIKHTPIASSLDTNARLATAEINIPLPIATGSNSPKLYYKINGGLYNSVNAFEVSGKVYKFIIPGQTPGTKISYYVASQDSAGTISTTSPFGGSGINPPGNVPPQTPNVYYILRSTSYTSNTVPKVILAGSSISDTIHISQGGSIKDMRVNINISHPNDAEIMILLKKVNGSTVFGLTLLNWNICGGSNFINTNFTDTAALSINQGTAPYTGYFKGRDSLSWFKNFNLQGDWILTVFDNDPAITGTLTGWNITFAYENTVSVIKESETIPSDYGLLQNYPNPFNPNTNIKFNIPKAGLTKVEVFDILGHKVETLISQDLKAGNYTISFDGSRLSSGVYYYKLTSDNFTMAKRMILVK
jgi:subtilisin-like proprotein convertase family protein